MRPTALRAASMSLALLAGGCASGLSQSASAADTPAAAALDAPECQTLSPEERASSPLATGDVVSVRELRDGWSLYGPKDQLPLRGARIVVAARPGVTAEWLQRVVACDIAHEAARPSVASDSPLAVAGVRSEVRSLGDSFAIELRSSGRAESKEILRRATALAAR